MEFKKYDSITNSYQEKFIEKIYNNGLGAEDYYVTEKIHGCNFQLIKTVDNYMCGSRNNILYNTRKGVKMSYIPGASDIMNLLSNNIRDAFITLQSRKLLKDELIVYGEMFGGNYPHEDVKKEKVKQIQKGVQYCPSHNFLAFDIRIDGEFVNTDLFIQICEEFGIPFVKPLLKGDLTKCLKYSNEFQTTIPTYYNLPEIENNTCEGVVIKPNKTLYIGKSRVILKNKNSIFEEKKSSKTEKVAVLGGQLNIIMNNLLNYITVNRLINILSHTGTTELGFKDIPNIIPEFNKDILSDFIKQDELGLEFELLEKSDKKIITNKMNHNSLNVLKQYIVKQCVPL